MVLIFVLDYRKNKYWLCAIITHKLEFPFLQRFLTTIYTFLIDIFFQKNKDLFSLKNILFF